MNAGRVLVAVYALFVLAAGGRSVAQLTTDPGRAPLAYVLSAVAASVYLVNLIVLPRFRRVAVACAGIELLGVVAVGTWSVARSSAFPDATVWSYYGIGYGFVPLVLPVLVLCWLARVHRTTPEMPLVTGNPH